MSILKYISKKSKQSQKLQELFEQIDSLLDSARILYTQSEDLKKVVELEKNSVQKSSSASHEISSMVATTADAAKELNQMAIDSNKAVTISSDSLKDLTQLIKTVDNTSQSLQQSVKNGLSEISSVTETMIEIKNKANMINEIVFQTKLLSFNASVEAARAGEHGKGFAVVAEEMGNLARASGQAAKEIESILLNSVERTKSQIDRVTNELEKAAEDTVNAINSVSKKTTDISSVFLQLETYSKNTESKAHEISHATSEQKIGVEEISQSLQSLEESSHKLDDMASVGNKSASELASNIESITKSFFEIAKFLGYELTKIEKPFDFNAAIKAHIDWKMKLSKYLENPDGSLQHDKVCLDNNCALGKWLYGDGLNFRLHNTQLFDRVKSSHASFHKSAGEIIKQINSGNLIEAKKLLSPNSAYISVSSNTIALIEKLKSEVEESNVKKVS